MGTISTHVLDTVRGQPGVGILVRLHQKVGEDWEHIADHHTDADGRVKNFMAHVAFPSLQGTYRLTFELASYFAKQEQLAFFPEASIVFAPQDATAHYHVPLLLSNFGYSTYRGS